MRSSLLVALILAKVAVVVSAGHRAPPSWDNSSARHAVLGARTSNNHVNSCISHETPTTEAPKLNVWAPITAEDNKDVWKLLHDPASGLNLTHPRHAVPSDNYVYLIDTLPTNKSDALSYIDGDGPVPAKYARVVIFEGGRDEPRSQEYMVGPLPVSEDTTIEPLDYIYNGGMGGAVPFDGRHFDRIRERAAEPLIVSIMTEISDITAAVFQGAVYYGLNDNRTTLDYTTTTPTSFDGTQSFMNCMFRFPGPASFMTPLDFYLLLDVTGTDPSTYFLKGFVIKEQFYPTVEDLRSAFEAGELYMEFDQTKDGSWALLDYHPELDPREFEERPAPTVLELGGKRYKLDREQQYVEYMGWSFYLSYSQTLGVMFFDIRFKGERILYELSLQEAMSQYGGYQPKAANTVYHDTYYTLGADMGPLLEGFDCPFGSTFWDLPFHYRNLTIINQGALCIFETDIGYPVARHRTWGGASKWEFRNLAAVKGSALVVRAIATIGNYDYMFNYAFHVDGSIEISVHASGYLQSSFYYPDQKKWGPRIQKATMGSIHDHVLTFKADFDIVDAANSFQVSKLVAVEQSQPWFPELGTFEQMELDIHYIETEKRLNWPANNAGMFCVVNKDQTNAWGEYRGYRIVPARSNIHLTTMDSPWSKKNSEFAKQHVAVSRQHDTEPFANSIQNINLPWKPQQDFSKFFDGESLDQEDLVVWVNMGMHHFTRAEDVPMTLYTEAYASMVFAPQNFFDRAPVDDLRNRRYIVPRRKEGEDAEYELEFETYGVALPRCEVELPEPAFKISPVAVV
ncbi:hypothetical protein VTO42DRAFT_1831 [Malbranchea cinnamomea]